MGRSQRYQVVDVPGGFRVERTLIDYELEGAEQWLIDLALEERRLHRRPVTVTATPYGFRDDASAYQPGVPRGPLPLVSFYGLCRRIAGGLMCDWVAPKEPWVTASLGAGRHAQAFHTATLLPWAISRTAASINRLVYPRWKAVVAAANPTVVEVQRKVFAATFGYGATNIVQAPELYDPKQKFIVQDIITYRAAAVAALLADAWPNNTGEAIEGLSDWKSLFAPDGITYRALNETLMHLPGGVSANVLMKLRSFFLPRPIYNRLELITACLANDPGFPHPHARLLTFAPADDIREAMRKLAEEVDHDLSHRRTEDIRNFVMFLRDYPDQSGTTATSLTGRAIRYHRHELAERARRQLEKYGPDTLAGIPPVELPQVSGIRFLRTVGDIIAEGEAMRHCVGSYAGSAVDGDSYLFHISYKGENATVEVCNAGRVVQARGPRNTRNKAAEWGRRKLNAWGRRMRMKLIAEIELERLRRG